MKKALSGKIWTAVCISIGFIIIIGLIVLAVTHFRGVSSIPLDDILAGASYSVDGGPWMTAGDDGLIHDRFDRISVKFELPAAVREASEVYNSINISSSNVWYRLETGDGNNESIAEYKWEDPDMELDRIYKIYSAYVGSNDDHFLTREEFKETIPELLNHFIMPDTPGYSTSTVKLNIGDKVLKDGKPAPGLILTVENPYRDRAFSFSECFHISITGNDGLYASFFADVLPSLLLFVLVCFFGVFLFPIAGFILGKIDYRYLTFGALCFSWGLYMIGRRTADYLNMWIYDSTVCLAIVTLLEYCLVISILAYFKSNIKKQSLRLLANVILSVYVLAVCVAVAGHFSAAFDLYVSSLYMRIASAICVILLGILLFADGRKSRATTSDREEVHVAEKASGIHLLIAWSPLALTMIIDAVNRFADFTDIHFFYFGLAITMIYQIVRMIQNLRFQYKEAIRYQQLQKELYEAEVSLMVSQIQPHFMYNTLSSIALLCKKDPDTAFNATVTFSDYLRVNMDSLKEKSPVPFERELEHVKKYLYIEGLRFRDRLNVEYDIQATGFSLPILSIQPIVENAVKHGVTMKREGGTVAVSTRELEDCYEIIVKDDGVGFDPSTPRKDDGRSHVGMENTKKRLHDMCGATVTVESTVGEGTCVTVRLPKQIDG